MSLIKSICLATVLLVFMGCSNSSVSWLPWSFNSQKGGVVVGAGEVKSDMRPLTNYSQIKIMGSMDVVVENQNKDTIEIVAQENLLPLIQTIIEGDSLTISTEKNYTTKEPMMIKIGKTDLKGVAVNGSGDVDLQACNEAGVSLAIAGSGDIKIKGATKKLNASIVGSGDINAENLVAENGNINISGSGDAAVQVTGELNANIIGSGDIVYHGEPAKISKSIIGSGDIRKK